MIGFDKLETNSVIRAISPPCFACSGTSAVLLLVKEAGTRKVTAQLPERLNRGSVIHFGT